jgi:protein O-GlcNAc transferase
MAKDRNALLKLKQGLRARLQANPAWDVKVHTNALENVLMASLQQKFTFDA